MVNRTCLVYFMLKYNNHQLPLCLLLFNKAIYSLFKSNGSRSSQKLTIVPSGPRFLGNLHRIEKTITLPINHLIPCHSCLYQKTIKIRYLSPLHQTDHQPTTIKILHITYRNHTVDGQQWYFSLEWSEIT